ncbi:LacI family DNA-binding transcriptional regulator [Catellatospora chokoriensis]|uniref:LacI family DNA-binding transcriptional regulator n=1 Tax=Catellatospora chokoriensis TaxID=310353 RepID=UPI0035715418
MRCVVQLHVRQRGADVARRAEVPAGTVSNVLDRPATVREATRVKVQSAISDLGYVRGR